MAERTEKKITVPFDGAFNPKGNFVLICGDVVGLYPRKMFGEWSYDGFFVVRFDALSISLAT